jgi:hypothetical protein
VARWSKKLEYLKDEIAEVMREEKEEKQVWRKRLTNIW